MGDYFKWYYTVLIFLISFTIVKGQTINKVSANDGIWEDYGTVVSAKTYPEFHGRLVNVNWSDIETSPDFWNWAIFDSDVNQHIIDSMPVIILVYTGSNAPNWMYSNGVPQVNAIDSSGNIIAYSPYYLDNNYNYYFKRMIDSVCNHIQNYPSSTRNFVIGMQGCYGSTGDPIAYKGNVAPQYQITSVQFDSLFKVYSLYYYNDYQNLTPSIHLLSNPAPTDSSETYWLLSNCPGGWIKCGTFAKGSQINMELDKNGWLYNILNQPQGGQFVLSRSEIAGAQLYAGWWLEDHYKEMFGIMCYCIYWGLDWPNETSDMIIDHHYDSSFAFFNKYAGQKIPGLATNAVCALKDALDASDSIRFPSNVYGTVSQTNSNRYINIYNAYSSYGAKLEDVSAAMTNDLGSLAAKGTNDVGWHLLPGNYERYLHQINANTTSAGYWNVDDADSLVMYGRYARGFDIINKKNSLCFDVDDNFLRNAPLKGAYPVTIEITYFDSGYGSWGLFYDAVSNSNKTSGRIVCMNTHTWKKYKVVLKDANFGNNSLRNSDFYIQNTGRQNVIFSTVELSRTQLPDTGFITTSLAAFDTVCINSALPPNSFVLHASSLDGSNIQIGPFKNCSFSTAANGNFADTLFINNYSNNTINQTIYVKINTSSAITISGNIPITGGGKNKALINVNGRVLNTSPTLNATVTNVTCYNNKNGAIALQTAGGTGPFTYTWTNNIQQFWTATTQNINSLQPANYTVVVNSAYGCNTSKTFAITQPPILHETITQGKTVICKGGSTTVTVSATGGTPPYTGTGIFIQFPGFQLYPVSDTKSCSDTSGISINDGYLISPLKPDGIRGPNSVKSNQAKISYKVINPIGTNVYRWVVVGGLITSGQSTSSIIVTWGISAGTVSVYASNPCGNSDSTTLNVSINNKLDNNSDSTISDAMAKKLSSDDEIVLIPNPVRDEATIEFFTEISEVYTIEITDASGKKLLIQKHISLPGRNLEKLDVARFSAGLYIVTLKDRNGEKRAVLMLKE